MRCAVHTQQLAIRDGLKGEYASNLISEVRHVVTSARKPKVDDILRRRAGKGAIIDQATRWSSTYLMVKRLIELKPFLIDMANNVFHKVLLASIYIDPMHRILLNDDQLSNGRNTLLEVAYRLKGVTPIKTEKGTVKESHLKLTYSDEDMHIDFDKILDIQEMAKRRR